MYVGQKTKIHIKNHIPCLTPIFPHILSTTIGQKTESMQNGQNKEFFVTKPYSYPLFQAIILLAALSVPINHAPENKRKQYCHLLKLVIQRLLVPSHLKPCLLLHSMVCTLMMMGKFFFGAPAPCSCVDSHWLDDVD